MDKATTAATPPLPGNVTSFHDLSQDAQRTYWNVTCPGLSPEALNILMDEEVTPQIIVECFESREKLRAFLDGDLPDLQLGSKKLLERLWTKYNGNGLIKTVLARHHITTNPSSDIIIAPDGDVMSGDSVVVTSGTYVEAGEPKDTASSKAAIEAISSNTSVQSWNQAGGITAGTVGNCSLRSTSSSSPSFPPRARHYYAGNEYSSSSGDRVVKANHIHLNRMQHGNIQVPQGSTVSYVAPAFSYIAPNGNTFYCKNLASSATINGQPMKTYLQAQGLL